MSATSRPSSRRCPYIREFHGRTVVIKYGGAAMSDPALREEFARDVVLLKYVGMNPIVVHGGGPDITSYMERLGLPVEFIGGLRVSDEATVEVAKMVLVGKVNKDIVLRLGRHGQPAVGLCGDDGLLFRVATIDGPAGEDLGLVGRIERVDAGVIRHVAADYIPVIASVGADRDGRSHNVNADEAAGAVARAMGAYKVDLPHRRRRLAAGSVRSRIARLRDHRRRGRGRARARHGRHAPEAAGLHRRHPRRRQLRPHRRRPRAALAPARALHGRRHRHEGAARAVIALTDNYARQPVEFVRGEGLRLWDADGEEYLDFLAGISVCNVGHCHPRVVEAVRAQAGTLMHVSNLFFTRPMAELAERLTARSIGGRVYFANSGAEANEAALKVVRKARPRGEIVVVHGGFHGRTYGALSATPQESKQAPFAPLVPGFVPVPPDPDAIAAAVHEGTAAVLLEVIQGESGVIVLPEEVLRAARAACDATGAFLVLDEVQTGMGRTGTLWAYEQTGVVPDAITVAKALGGGLPIGALVCGERLAGVFAPGDHGSTFAGGPVVAAAALAAFDILDDPELLAACGSWASACASRCASCPACSTSAAAGSWWPPTSTPTRPAWRAARCSSSGS